MRKWHLRGANPLGVISIGTLVDRIRYGRLSNAWMSAMVGRVGAFLALVAVARAGVPASEAADYVVAFAALGFGLFLATTVSEGLVLSSEHDVGTRALWGSQYSVVAGVMGLATWVLVDSVVAGVGAGACLLLQYWIAQRRVALISMKALWIPNTSALARDALVVLAVAAWSMGWTPGFDGWLVASLFVGCALQFLALDALVRRRVGTSASYVAPLRAILLLMMAGGFYALQPYLVRGTISQMMNDAPVFAYEMADRLGYVVVLVAMGGIGTELQRRWAGLDNDRARQVRELIRAWVVLALAAVVVATVSLLIGERVLELLYGASVEHAPSPALLALTSIAGFAGVAGVLGSRLHLARGNRGVVARVYGVALPILLAGCIAGVAAMDLYGAAAASIAVGLLVAGIFMAGLVDETVGSS